MKKHFFFSLIIVGFSLAAHGQQVDYNKIILPKNASNISIEERLIQLAWENNPRFKILDKRKDVAVLNKRKTGNLWLDNIGVNGNLNEFNIKNFTDAPPANNTGTTNQFFPRYNVYVRIPFSIFSEQHLGNKIATKEVEIAREEVNSSKIAVRAQVLNAYDDYVRCKELLIITSKFEESEAADFSVKEQRFRNGEITLEDYNASKKNYLEKRILKVTSESNFNKTKIALEELIGVSIEGVIPH